MDDLVIAGGYRTCPGLTDRPCGEWFIPERGGTTTVCPACRSHLAQLVNEAVVVEVAGHVTSVGRDRRQRRRGSYASKRRERAVSRAKHRALARLKAAYPTIYDGLVNEELAKMGEKPMRTRTDAVRHLNREAVDAMD